MGGDRTKRPERGRDTREERQKQEGWIWNDIKGKRLTGVHDVPLVATLLTSLWQFID